MLSTVGGLREVSYMLSVAVKFSVKVSFVVVRAVYV